MSKKQKIDYLKRAETLRKYGFPVMYGKRGYKSAGDKSAVTRRWKKVRLYVEGDKQRFKFFKADSATTRKIRGVLSPIQITPTGFFFRVPSGAKSFKLKLDGENVETVAIGQKNGRRREVYLKLDPVEIAKDPANAVKSKIKKFKKFRGLRARVVVAGYDGKRDYPIEYFLSYMPEMLKQLLDPEREGDETFARKRIATNHRPLKPGKIADIFHVKLEYQTPSKHAKRTKKAQSKRKARK